ncbi:hypothetical protein HPB50_014450 [Hyalomma asiaticum]|uniref:Uncharacterized protein n=1 Tax=Hyalomma asiaticum TaxID=266040 RepID=A0ACB7T4U8_HYAAI|nr:hypothetical protein HPB50_014450 [Hyalomma asiaticum]
MVQNCNGKLLDEEESTSRSTVTFCLVGTPGRSELWFPALERSPFTSKDFRMQGVLDHQDTDELFAWVEANMPWQAFSLSVLRRKLVSASVGCVPDSVRAMPAPALDSAHICVDAVCSKFCRCRNIARRVQLRPSMVFLSYHADLNEDKPGRSFARIRVHLSPQYYYFTINII